MDTLVEKFYKGQYLTFTDRGLTDPLSAVVGWDVLQYQPGYYQLGETMQLSSDITCNAVWEDLHITHKVEFFVGGNKYGATQYVQHRGSAVEPYPPPRSPYADQVFAYWDPAPTNITADTSCDAKFSDLVSAIFCIKKQDELRPFEFARSKFVPRSTVTQADYPSPSAINYYTFEEWNPKPPFSITQNEKVVYSYLSNKFDINISNVFSYDGKAHGLQVDVEMNNHPSEHAEVRFSESEDGPWSSVSPTVSQPGEAKVVYYQVKYENYRDFVDHETIQINHGHTLKFNYKTGTGIDKQKSYTAIPNEKFTLKDDLTSLYTGHTFKYWYDHDGISTILERPITADADLSAEYSKSAYTCRFFNYDGSQWMTRDDKDPTNKVNYLEKFNRPDPYDTKKDIDEEHKDFIGWYDLYSRLPVEDDLNSATRNLSAQAYYDDVQHFRLLSATSGSDPVEVSSMLVTKNDRLIPNFDFVAPTVPGYVFERFDPSTNPIQMTADIDVSAYYSTAIKTATFHANWEGAVTMTSALTGAAYTYFHETPYKVFEAEHIGYSVESWNTDPEYHEHKVPILDFTLIESNNYYAKWQINVYSVILDSNLGILSSGNISSYTYGETKILPTYPDISNGKLNFLGWKNSDDSYATQISSTDTGDKVFVADWEPRSFRVTFNSNGGDTPTPSYMEMMYGQTVDEFPTCTRAGYSFDGWFTDPTGGTEHTTPYKVRINDDVTWYAHWIEDQKQTF